MNTIKTKFAPINGNQLNLRRIWPFVFGMVLLASCAQSLSMRSCVPVEGEKEQNLIFEMVLEGLGDDTKGLIESQQITNLDFFSCDNSYRILSTPGQTETVLSIGLKLIYVLDKSSGDVVTFQEG